MIAGATILNETRCITSKIIIFGLSKIGILRNFQTINDKKKIYIGDNLFLNYVFLDILKIQN